MTDQQAWYPPENTYVKAVDMSLKYLIDLMQSGALDLNSDFQRRSTWSRDEQSRFVESLLLNFPVPSLLFSEEPDGRLLVIDGKQRLTAIDEFLRNQFGLAGITAIPEFLGLRFDDLPRQAQNQLLSRCTLRISVLNEASSDWVKRELFVRINTSGETLSRQELRNARYSGALNDAIYQMADDPFLVHQLNITGKRADMLNAECVLRFLALSGEKVILRKDPFIADTMDDFMDRHKGAKQAEVNQLVQKFRRALRACESLWGDKSFKRFQANQWRGQWSVVIYDAQMLACDQVHDDLLAASGRNAVRVVELTEAAFMKNDDLSTRLGASQGARARQQSRAMIDIIVKAAQG